jgi:hypothetical protein
MSETAAPDSKKIWHHSRPEDRLSIAFSRFLDRSLVRPCYFTAINDADHGNNSDLQRIRDANRGVRSGQLDLDIWQGPPALARKLELKRGKNKPTEHQARTIADLTACGAPPIVAWTLQEAFDGLVAAGFRFLPNVATTLAHMEEQLAAWDREAALVRGGVVVKKRAQRAGPRVRVRPGLSWKLTP